MIYCLYLWRDKIYVHSHAAYGPCWRVHRYVGSGIPVCLWDHVALYSHISALLRYEHYYSAEDYDLTISDLSIINTLALVFTNFGIFIVNFKIFKFPHRVISLIAVLGMSLSTLALSFVKSFALYIILYGFVFGFFIGFGYLAPLKNTYEHLPNRKGTDNITQAFVVELV